MLIVMKSITLRQLARDSRFGRRAHAGESFLVTHRGRPYFRILPLERPPCHVGAGTHLGAGQAVSPEPVPPGEWGDLRP